MTRVQFLNALYQRLEGMSKAEAEEYLTYYAEMLADRMEEGMSEEEAVASMEDTETIARRILQERATGAASVPPAYPDLPPREPMAAPAGKARGSRDRRPLIRAAAWVLAVAVAAAVLWQRFGAGRVEGSPVGQDTATAVEEAIVSDSGIYIGPEGIRVGDAVYVGPEGIILGDVNLAEATETWDAGENWSGAMADYAYQGDALEWAAGDVGRVGIDWAAGQVRLESWDGDTVRAVEQSTDALTGETAFSCALTGEDLTIRYQAGQWSRVRSAKLLTVLLPSGWAGTVSIHTSAADVTAEKMAVEEINVSTESGGVVLSGLTASDLTADTTSGDIVLSGCDGGRLRLDSVSGDMLVGESLMEEEAQVESVSGDILLSGVDAGQVEVHTVSGEVTWAGALDRGFTLRFDSTSGTLDSGDLALVRSGDTYVYEGGGCEIRVTSVSGDLRLSAQ